MSHFVETPPTDEAIKALLPLADFKAHLRITDDLEDAIAETMLIETYRVMDGRDGFLGRAVLPQSWRLVLDCFPTVIVLPLPDLIAVTSITYLDTAGDPQTLPAEDYAIIEAHRSKVIPAKGKTWPSTWDFPGAVEVIYQAGYADPASVPPPIKRAIMMQAATIFENRESVLISNFAMRPLAAAIDLLTPYREHEF